MAKVSKRERRRQARDLDLYEGTNVTPIQRGVSTYSRKKPIEPKPLHWRSEAQYHYAEGIKNNTVTFGLGPAGTGKTYVPAALAADMFLRNEIDRIIITRPMQAGDDEDMGALPGTVQEKFEPWFAPVRTILESRLGAGAVECHIKNGNIQVVPFQVMRGLTFERAFVILDEAQNTTPRQMELFLTRIGEHSKVVVEGDVDQSDIGVRNGLRDAVTLMRGVHSAFFYEFTIHDIIRHGIVAEFLKRYRKKQTMLINIDDAADDEGAVA